MQDTTIPHVCPPATLVRQPFPRRPLRHAPKALEIECGYHAVRHNLWCAQFTAQILHLDEVRDRISPLLMEVDRLIAELDLS